ncbi:MAG: hypothetical protein KF858_17100 [Candidatus Sumerlaeia bacterium]|nr:hypothetical protein [Candidatus Sumerlaeia bacterium]
MFGEAVAGEQLALFSFRPVEGKPRQVTVEPEALRAEAAAKSAELLAAMERMAQALGGRVKGPRVKRLERMLEKMKEDKLPDARASLDVLAGSVIFEGLDDVQAALNYLAEAEDWTVVRIKDRFETPNVDGYRDILLNVELSGGHVAEVQLHVEAMIEAKDAVGHLIYEASRALNQKVKAERRVYRALLVPSRRLYDFALRSVTSENAASNSRASWSAVVSSVSEESRRILVEAGKSISERDPFPKILNKLAVLSEYETSTNGTSSLSRNRSETTVRSGMEGAPPDGSGSQAQQGPEGKGKAEFSFGPDGSGAASPEGARQRRNHAVVIARQLLAPERWGEAPEAGEVARRTGLDVHEAGEVIEKAQRMAEEVRARQGALENDATMMRELRRAEVRGEELIERLLRADVPLPAREPRAKAQSREEEEAEAEAEASGFAGGTGVIRRFLAEALAVNPYSALRVVDESGEPLVAYHGTARACLSHSLLSRSRARQRLCAACRARFGHAVLIAGGGDTSDRSIPSIRSIQSIGAKPFSGRPAIPPSALRPLPFPLTPSACRMCCAASRASRSRPRRCRRGGGRLVDRGIGRRRRACRSR